MMQIKNMKRYFTFEVQILDDQNMKRRFRFSNYQSASKVMPFSCSMPIGLTEGWNLVNINLPSFTRRAYGTNYLETVKIQIHANCRVRRIYFADRLYSDNELPSAYRMYQQIGSGKGTENPK
uniref:CFA20 domain-containing protein n=2 Tax=Clastoptera arizonana TaxID=38151 RepID=A0A1B6CGA1_9HEMI